MIGKSREIFCKRCGCSIITVFGRVFWCSECKIIVRREQKRLFGRKEWLNNKERVKKRVGVYISKNSVREKKNLRQRVSYQIPEVKKRKAEYTRMWRGEDTNSDKYAGELLRSRVRRGIKYQLDFIFKEKINYKNCINRTKGYFAEDCFSFNEWLDKKLSVDGVCQICKKKVGLSNLQMDHDFAVSLAKKEFLEFGIVHKYSIEEMTPVCLRCNRVKRTKRLIEVLV